MKQIIYSCNSCRNPLSHKHLDLITSLFSLLAHTYSHTHTPLPASSHTHPHTHSLFFLTPSHIHSHLTHKLTHSLPPIFFLPLPPTDLHQHLRSVLLQNMLYPVGSGALQVLNTDHLYALIILIFCVLFYFLLFLFYLIFYFTGNLTENIHRCMRKKLCVRFDVTLRVVLIPARSDYECSNLIQDLWWHESKYFIILICTSASIFF